jgi:hypothetical protein
MRSDVLFRYGGNNFAGTFFWFTGIALSTPEIIHISGNTNQSIACTEQLRGLYFNTQRGRSLRPIDATTKTILQNALQDYTNMTLSGGFYTKCTLYNGTYTP